MHYIRMHLCLLLTCLKLGYPSAAWKHYKDTHAFFVMTMVGDGDDEINSIDIYTLLAESLMAEGNGQEAVDFLAGAVGLITAVVRPLLPEETLLLRGLYPLYEELKARCSEEEA